MAFETTAFYCRNGDYYSGQVSRTMDGGVIANGVGFRQSVGGDVYRGEFLNGQYHGYGIYRSSGGDWYEGFFYQNLRHGEGKLFTASRQRLYVGSFVNDAEHGYGTIIKVKEAVNGRGKQYIGQVRNGQRHGLGTLTFTAPDGRPIKFEGQWHNDLLHGPGSQTDPSECLLGIFVNGKLQGPGTRTDLRTGLTYQMTFPRS
jgi:hypothetical protein